MTDLRWLAAAVIKVEGTVWNRGGLWRFRQPVSGQQMKEPYEIVVELIGSGVSQPDVQMVEEAINEITVPAINCTVKFREITIADHATQLGLWEPTATGWILYLSGIRQVCRILYLTVF